MPVSQEQHRKVYGWQQQRWRAEAREAKHLTQFGKERDQTEADQEDEALESRY